MWYFYSPNIIYGEDAIDFMENIEGEKCFVVTDNIIKDLGYLKIVTDKLEELGKDYKVFDEVVPDPKADGVLKAREQCINYSPDLIIGLGGGSVMDTAKTAWALYEFQDMTLDDLHPFNPRLYQVGKKSKLIAIPTTSGTGAETTFAVVVSVEEMGVWRKSIQAHKGLIPSFAIVDPRFPAGMPPKLTADTGFDALAHALEGMVSSWKNEFSYALGLRAIEMIFEFLPIAYKDGDNMHARDMMHQAATMAGLSFGNGQVHIGHTLGHSLGTIFHTSHGRAVGIFLKYVTQFCLNNPDGNESVEIYSKMAKQLGWANWDDSDEEAANSVIDKIKELEDKVDIPHSFKGVGLPKDKYEESIDKMVQLCFMDASGTMAPRSPNKADFEKLYRYAYEGKDVDW
ncbi:MAG: iron-containing alcohol dehydrogenase [Promethearchaeati archaeon]